MNVENALKPLGKVEYVIVTNPKGDVLEIEYKYIKSET